MTWPIAVLGFDKPKYLAALLSCLIRQKNAEIGEIALFQDGAVGRETGERYADDRDIAANVAVFRAYFPKGEVFQSPVNVGIARNTDRAERWLFEGLGSEVGILFEDDLVVVRYYLQTLEVLIRLMLEDTRIGYVACYGCAEFPLPVQKEHRYEFAPLRHNWGCALTRRQYLLARPYLDLYHALIDERPDLPPALVEISDLVASRGLKRMLPPQDLIRAAICAKTDTIRINTVPCLGKYIGEEGTHHTPEFYRWCNWPQTELYNGPLTQFGPLPDEFYETMVNLGNKWRQTQRMGPQEKQWLAGMGLVDREWIAMDDLDDCLHAEELHPLNRAQLLSLDAQGRRRI